jgi:hypothetical protein
MEHHGQQDITRLHFEKMGATCSNKRFEKIKRTPARFG